MTSEPNASDALRKAAAIIQKLERRLEANARALSEPVAILGAGCRLPGGVTDVASLWQLLSRGEDAVGPIPGERFDASSAYSGASVPDSTYVRNGAFLQNVDGFDADFFGISPREAAWIDPQHRLLIECSYEALENAGIPWKTLRGTSTGVYVGLGASDYAYRLGVEQKLSLEGYFATGTGASFSAGRVAFLLGLQGPALTVDTACSSSLAALHLACRGLRAGDCRLALVGGVQLMLSAQPFVLLSRLRALSPDGRCKAFSKQADGYGRGEGCGVVVLKLLSEAVRDGDPILGVIKGSAVNQDGASSGLTTPNGSAQRTVLRRALAESGLVPTDVDYVEAHGTGTPLGDPIEVEAIADVYGRERSTPLWIGSVKTNIGHLEPASGIAGVLKILCSFEHQALAASLHAEELSQHVDWPSLGVRVVQQLRAWDRAASRPRRAGVSAFGMSGTNAHVILEEAPVIEHQPSAPVRSAELLVLSAKTDAALSAVAGALREHLELHPNLSLGDVAQNLVATRSLLEHRLMVVVSSRAALLDVLAGSASGKTPAGAVRGTVQVSPCKVAWLFTGQGAQRLGMGRELYGQWSAFREALDGVCGLLDPLLDVPLREVMWAGAGSARAALLSQTGFTQPALFAFEWALACLWRSWGVEPELLLGHSVGAIAAAAVAGIFTLEDAARLVAARARLMQGLAADGAMVSIAAAEALVLEEIRPYVGTVSLAAVNGPDSVVISGREQHVLALAEGFERQGVPTKRLSVSHAFHSPSMEPMLEAFQEVAASIRYQPARIPLIADTPEALAGSELGTARYWVRHVRETVRFAAGVQALAAAGVDTFLEVGPGQSLLGLVRGCLQGSLPTLLASSRSSRSESESVLDALGGLAARGGQVEWKGVFPSGGRRISLPTYPWQRKRHWVDGERPSQSDASTNVEASLRQLAECGELSTLAQSALPEILNAVSAQRTATELDATVSSWFQRLVWRPIPLPPSTPRAAEEAWAVLGGSTEEAACVAAALQRSGRKPYLANLDNLPGLLRREGALQGLIDLPDFSTRREDRVLAIEQLLTGPFETRAWWVTRGGVGTGPQDPPAQPLQSVVWGLGRTFALEQPRTWGGLLDLPPEKLSDAIADRVVALITAPQGEDQVALRSDGAFAPRIVAHEPDRSQPTRAVGPGTALITGGLGALGLQVARWLARRREQHLLLLGRHGLATPGARAAVAQLESLGASVTVAAADVTDRDAMSRVLEAIPADAPLSTIFHTAGIGDFTPIQELTPGRLADVLAAKREGTLVLDELTRSQPLRAFVCFSSIAGVWGGGGQAAYAAANAFQDAWAHAARALGRPAYSISWGPWADGGMADEAARAQLERRGLHAMDPRFALHALERVLRADPEHTAVVQVDWQLFRRSFEAWRPRPVLLEVQPGQIRAVDPVEQEDHLLRTTLSSLPVAEREDHLCAWLATSIAAILSIADATTISQERPFRELGMDSLMAVELRTILSSKLGFPLSSDVGLDPALSSTRTLARRLLPMIAAEDPAALGEVDIYLDAILDAEIRPLPAALPTMEPTSVLLTGATGFLGAFLLSELLSQTRAHIICLVRAKSRAEGLQRVERNLAAYGLSSAALEERTSILLGDLSEPLLGLGQQAFTRLSEEVDAVYNNGAHVSYVAGYDELKPSHVQATRELLRLASMGRPKAFHHVSSVAAFDAPEYRGQSVSETTVPVSGRGLHLAYAQCKWVAETLVREAAARGFVVTIHRPSFVGGAANGAWNTTDFLCRILKGGAIDLGCLPEDLELLFDFSPVDFVARSIVYLSRQPGSAGRTFHLQHPTGILFSRLREMLRSFGYAVEPVPYTTWLNKLSEEPGKPLHPLLPYFMHRWPPENLTYLELASVGVRAQFRNEETLRLLARANIHCPPLDHALFHRYFSRLAEVGFVAPPRGAL